MSESSMKLRKDGTPDRRASGLRKPRVKVSLTCIWCGNSFTSANSNAKYCTTSCVDKSRYQRDKEKRLAAVQKYRKDNKDLISARRKKDWAENKDKRRAQNQKSYQKNREARLLYAKEYQKRNPHIVSATALNRKSKGEFKLSGRDMRRIQAIQNNKCYYCQCTMSSPGRSLPTSLQWDHVVPLSRGGKNSFGNIVAACRACNSSKSAMLIVEWRRFKKMQEAL